MTIQADDPEVLLAASWTLEEAYEQLGAALLGGGLGLGPDDDDGADVARGWFNRRLNEVAKAVCTSQVRGAVGESVPDDLIVVMSALAGAKFGSAPVILAAAAVVVRRGLDKICVSYDAAGS